MRILLTFFILSLSIQSFAYQPINLLPQGSRVGIAISTLNNQQLNINEQQLFPPASTLKIFTALAAKLELGDSFRFSTQLEHSNNDLIIRFSGDPTLTTQDLDALFKMLVVKGETSIKGNIWLNNSIFTGYERAVGWPWDILGVCYSAPASAITLDKNCVQASIYTEKNGSTRVHVPKHQPINVISNTISVTETEKKERQCDLELTTSNNNHYLLSGCLIQRSKPLPLKFAVQQTQNYTQSVIEHLLTKYNIKFNGTIGVSNTASGDVIATHLSEPLPKLLDKMLKESNNLIADNLTKTLGHRFFVHPGSFKNGTEAIKQIISVKTGIDISDAQLADGSGLSRNNRVTVDDMNQVLEYIWRNEEQLQFISLLPKAGKSGTLKYRRSMRKAPIVGQLQAKSGSLYGSYNMAGYVLNNSGKPKATFVQFVTDYYPEKKEDANNTLPPIFQFEKAFYNDLITRSLKSD